MSSQINAEKGTVLGNYSATLSHRNLYGGHQVGRICEARALHLSVKDFQIQFVYIKENRKTLVGGSKMHRLCLQLLIACLASTRRAI